MDNADPPTHTVNEAREAVDRVAAPGGQDSDNAQWSIAGVDGGTNCQRLSCAGSKDHPGSTAVYVSRIISTIVSVVITTNKMTQVVQR